MQILRRGMIARPARHQKVASSLVRRLVQAQDDPAKRRIRAWLRDLHDAQLSGLGLTSEGIAVLRDKFEPSRAVAEQTADGGICKGEKESSKMADIETILSASARLHGRATQSVSRSVVRVLQRWWAAYTAWRLDRRAIADLLSMSDRDLRDIGINRCEILRAVRGDTARERVSMYDAMPIACAISRPSN